MESFPWVLNNGDSTEEAIQFTPSNAKNMGSAWHTADTIISVFLVKDAVREPILEK